MDVQRKNELEALLIEYKKKLAELFANVELMKESLMEEIDKAVPCHERVDLCNLMENNIKMAEECRKMFVDLVNAGYPPPGKPLEQSQLFN